MTTAVGSVNLSGYSQVKGRVGYLEIFSAILLQNLQFSDTLKVYPQRAETRSDPTEGARFKSFVHLKESSKNISDLAGRKPDRAAVGDSKLCNKTAHLRIFCLSVCLSL